MWKLFLFIMTLIVTTVPVSAEEKPVPAHLLSCVENAIGELALIDGSEESVRRLFAKYVDDDSLGRATYGAAWNTANQIWRDAAIELYFSLLYSKGTAARGSATVVAINHRLADYPERGGDGSNGYWHIVFSARLSTGSSVSAAVLLTDNCKVLDLSPGMWLSSIVSASAVDAFLR
jgi:hypothetical protein